jgi:hypothetical protein
MAKKIIKRTPKHKSEKHKTVIKLPLDIPYNKEKTLLNHFWSYFQIETATIRDVAKSCEEFWPKYFAIPEADRDKDTKYKVRQECGIDRNSINEIAKNHADNSKWLNHNTDKTGIVQISNRVTKTVDRYLNKDKSGKRSGLPKLHRFRDFTSIPGNSVNWESKQWQGYRLIGSLQGHANAYANGTLIEDGLRLKTGIQFFKQPANLRVPKEEKRGDFWNYDGPLAVVATNGGNTFVLPVRLPSGTAELARLQHFLGDKNAWSKITLVRIPDAKARNGWRYEAHLLVFKEPYRSQTELERQEVIKNKSKRIAGQDPNVSNITTVSVNQNFTDYQVTRFEPKTVILDKHAKLEQAKRKAQKKEDRSRRAANPEQYELSKPQTQRAARRKANNLKEKQVELPKGKRKTNKNNKPKQRYAKDTKTKTGRKASYKVTSLSHQQKQLKDQTAREMSRDLINVHGIYLTVEQNTINNWFYNHKWTKALTITTPGRYINSTQAAIKELGGTFQKASTFHVAASQTCLCGSKVKKDLNERTHFCPDCGLTGDRDELSALIHCCVRVTKSGKATLIKSKLKLAEKLVKQFSVNPQEKVGSRSTLRYLTGDSLLESLTLLSNRQPLPDDTKHSRVGNDPVQQMSTSSSASPSGSSRGSPS